MGFVKEFKEFAMRGSVVDLAIGVVIGAAFGRIIGSFTEDVLTPLILKPALEFAQLSKIEDLTVFGTVKYGKFLAVVINFIIIAFVLFLIIKAININKKEEQKTPDPPAPTKEELLLTEIRDLLKNNSLLNK